MVVEYDVSLHSLEPGRWEWEQLYNPYEFDWKYGVTPFSNIQLVFSAIAVYLVVVFSLQNWMKDKSAFSMRRATQVHNAILCVWSLAMFVGISYGSYKKAQARGWYTIICDKDFEGTHGTYWYWSYMFYLSKYYELLDTIILVLKKKPLTVLHVWHHSIMVLFTWLLLAGDVAVHWWGVFLNTLVHVFMYYYFYVATLNQHPWWKKYLTKAQIVQFVGNMGMITYYLYTDYYEHNGDCVGDDYVIWFSQSVNFSFLGFFVNFYVQTYKENKLKKV